MNPLEPAVESSNEKPDSVGEGQISASDIASVVTATAGVGTAIFGVLEVSIPAMVAAGSRGAIAFLGMVGAFLYGRRERPKKFADTSKRPHSSISPFQSVDSLLTNRSQKLKQLCSTWNNTAISATRSVTPGKLPAPP